MPLKTVFAPHINRTVKMGRTRPVKKGRKYLRLSDYLIKGQLPTPPDAVDYRKGASKSLRNIFLNDQLGDCVIAAGYHVTGTATGNAGGEFVATDKQITADYSAIGGYVPGDESTDQGCDEETGFAYWESHGFANGTKLIGHLTVDASNQNEVKTALWLFENVFFGTELPDEWISPFPSDDTTTWDVAGKPNPENGHAYQGVAYGVAGVIVDTWALYVTQTWKALAKYNTRGAGGQLFSLFTPDMLAKGQAKCPNGIDWASLIADFQAMGGTVVNPPPTPDPAPPAPTPAPPAPTPAPPAPSPSPAPAPSPTPEPPAPGLSLGQCEQAIRSYFKHSKRTVYSPGVAADDAVRALRKNWPA